MALKKYKVDVNGTQTVLKLNVGEAERLGLTKAQVPSNKMATPANKEVTTPARKEKVAPAKKRFGRK